MERLARIEGRTQRRSAYTGDRAGWAKVRRHERQNGPGRGAKWEPTWEEREGEEEER